MEYFRVRNWDRFQHYRKRNPPWIKLYTELLDDYEFACLSDASKLLAFCIFMLAARSSNKIPLDPDWIRNRAALKSMPDLEPLFNHGFIVRCQDASETLAQRKQDAMPETEQRQSRGEQTEEKGNGQMACRESGPKSLKETLRPELRSLGRKAGG